LGGLALSLYRRVQVWARTKDGAVLYQCLEVLGKGFTVQSKDYFTQNERTERFAYSESQFVELLMEQAPDERSPVFSTLQEAIERFEGCPGE